MDDHLKKAEELYKVALDEVEEARKLKGPDVNPKLRDACAKGWLALIEATYSFLLTKGVREEDLPKTDRGRRYFVSKYMAGELSEIFLELRENLHILGYYEGLVDFYVVPDNLKRIKEYIDKVSNSMGN